MEVILIVLIVFVAILAVGYPLVNPSRYRRSAVAIGNGAESLETLESAREMALDAIHDVEFEHQTGKLSEADYTALRTTYEARAVRVLQQLDNLEAAKKRPSPAGKAKAKDRCGKCQAALEPTDRFCPRCGTLA